jgi:hypothetical protein
MLSDNFNSQCTGIISQPDSETLSATEDKNNILIDNRGVIDKTNLHTSTTVLIITENGNIKNIIQLIPDNIDSMEIYCKIK